MNINEGMCYRGRVQGKEIRTKLTYTISSNINGRRRQQHATERGRALTKFGGRSNGSSATRTNTNGEEREGRMQGRRRVLELYLKHKHMIVERLQISDL